MLLCNEGMRYIAVYRNFSLLYRRKWEEMCINVYEKILIKCEKLILVYSLQVSRWTLYTVKKVCDIPVPNRDVTYQSPPGRDILAGDGNVANFFYGVQCTYTAHPVGVAT